MQVLKIIKFQPSMFKSSPYRMLLIFLLPAIVVSTRLYLNTQKPEPREVNISVVDMDESETSRLVVERLGENDLLELKDYKDPMRALMRLDIDALFIIKEGFDRKILSGNIAKTVELYYSPGNITPELIAEIFSKEVMRIYVSEQAIDFVEAEYKKRGMDFTEQLRLEAVEYTESFWQKGLTVPVKYEYSKAGAGHIAAGTIKTVVTVTLECAAVMLLILGLGAGLMRQKEDGIFRRLRLCGISDPAYCSVCMTACSVVCACCLFAALAAIGETRLWLSHALYFIWAGLFAAFLTVCLKKESAYLTAIPLLAVAVSFSGGAAFYAKDTFAVAAYLGALNPVYCVLTGQGLLVHILLLVVVLLLQRRNLL